MLKVAPSILSADFANMQKCVQDLKEWGADVVHCDVMDGVYVPNITFGMPMIKALRQHTDLPLDVHLMIVNPEKYVEKFCDAGADYVTFHPEVCANVENTLNLIRQKGKKCGLVVNANVDFEIVLPYLAQIDILLIMTVQAGFGGQSLIAECLDKAQRAKSLKERCGYRYEIEVDGGVGLQNVAQCKDAGVDIVVAGSSIFNAENPEYAIAKMKI